MVATFDAEDLKDSILDLMTSGDLLNTYIAAIDAEKTAKGKALVKPLDPIASNAYFRQSWTNEILNRTPAIYYGIEDQATQDGGEVTAVIYKLFVEVILLDSGMLNDSDKRIDRYARALKELFSDKFDGVSNGSHIKIETVRPISYKLEMDSSEEIKIGGVSINISLV